MRVFLALVCFALLINAKRGKKNRDPKHCEVCIKVVDEIKTKAYANSKKPSPSDFDDAITSVCRTYPKGSTNKRLVLFFFLFFFVPKVVAFC